MVLLVCLAAAGLQAWRIEDGIVHRLREKVEELRKVAEGDLSFRVDIKAKDEVGELGRVINETKSPLRDEEGIQMWRRPNPL